MTVLDESKLFSSEDPDSIGIEVAATDYKPQIPTIEVKLPGDQVQSWFFGKPRDSSCAIRLLICPHKGPTRASSNNPLPFSQKVTQQAIWTPGDYVNLWHNPAGGSSALLSSPWRFIMQTPDDNGRFCSFALSVRGHCVQGVYTYIDPSFSPSSILSDEIIQGAWQSSGLQIACLPVSFLKAHSVLMAQDLAAEVAQVDFVEDALAAAPSSTQRTQDFAPLTRTLHTCSKSLINLKRRSKFESILIESISAVLEAAERDADREAPTLQAVLNMQRNVIASRDYDLSLLSQRIQESRSTIFNLILQHNQAVNLSIQHANVQIAESSRRIAEATMSDSASMKTIAILTMVFLPGTAVASFFSITMFNWNANPGQGVVSGYLWVYFVLAVPLTAIVLAIWWISTKRREKELRRQNTGGSSGDLLSDVEMGNVEEPASVDEHRTSEQEDFDEVKKER